MASPASLDLPRFHAAVSAPATEKLLQDDLDEARRIGAKAVPTWYVSGVEFVGARPDAELITAITEALKRSRRLTRSAAHRWNLRSETRDDSGAHRAVSRSVTGSAATTSVSAT